MCYILANSAGCGATLPKTDFSLVSVLSVVTAEWGGAEVPRRIGDTNSGVGCNQCWN